MHFAISCPPLPGHLNPFCALGRTLVRRGHTVTVFGLVDLESTIRRENLDFVPLALKEYPRGRLSPAIESLKERQGFRSTSFAIREMAGVLRAILEHGPGALRASGVDAVLADQNEPGMASVAEHLGLPFASICTSLPINREPEIPPSFSGWGYRAGLVGRFRNKIGYSISDLLTRRLQATLNEYRVRWGLNALRSPDDSFSKLLQLAQMPPEFEFPRKVTWPEFRFTGPWFDHHFEHSMEGEDFPFHRLDGRPLVYASLGTLQSSNSRHFHAIAEACTGLPFQVVISVGGRKGGDVPQLPGDPIVVPYAPQIEVLRRASLTITHAGMNTTMQALSFGMPLIAIPMAHDQPAIAARLARTGAGIVIHPSRVTAQRLRSAIQAIHKPESSWQRQARRMQQAIANAGDVETAADYLEQALEPVRARSASA